MHREQRDVLRAELIALGKGLEQDLAELDVAAGRGEGARREVEGAASSRPRLRSARSARSSPITSARPPSSRRDGAASRSATTPARRSRCTKALQLAPNDPQAESLLGWAQMLQEKYDDALMQFQKVLMREPGNALARINVGYICLKKRIFGEAIEHLSQGHPAGQRPQGDAVRALLSRPGVSRA